MRKQQLRRLFRAKLKNNLKGNYFTCGFLKKLQTLRLLSNFKQLYNNFYSLQKCKTIALYYPLYYEINCLPITAWLRQLNIVTLLPKIVSGNKKLSFYQFKPGQKLVKNSIGVKEPIADSLIIPEALIIPLLAFDDNGTRLGQGGGFYDYTLAELQKNNKTIVIGVAYSWQKAETLPQEPHDIKLNAIVTQKFYKIFS